jgi:hypothetical protein
MTWITISILGFAGVFWNIEAGLTPPEIAHSVVCYGGLLWWYFHRVVIAGKPIRWTPGSILIMLLYLQMLLLFPVSVGYGAEPYVWLREIVILGSFLLLVPIAHECDTRVKQYIVLGAMVISPSALAVKNLLLYKQKVAEAVWMWQVGASRATEAVYYVFVMAVLAAALFLVSQRLRSRLFFAVLFSLGVASTILSFYRTLWVGLLAAFATIAFVVGTDLWTRAAKYIVVLAAVIGIAYPIVLADVVPMEILWKSITSRFESIGEYRTDVSVTNRDAEARASIEAVEGNWLFGKGIAVPLHFTKLTSFTTIAPTWTHNGYAWVLHHFGIIGTFFLFGAWLWYAWLGVRTERLLRRADHIPPDRRFRLRVLSGAVVAVVVGSFVISIPLNQFMSHESAFSLAVLFGLQEVWSREAGKGEEVKR